MKRLIYFILLLIPFWTNAQLVEDVVQSVVSDAVVSILGSSDPCAAVTNLVGNSGVILDGNECTTDWINPSDGMAEGWLKIGTGTASIVTGNGFVGNAQKYVHTNGSTSRSRYNGAIADGIIGETYQVSGKYRCFSSNTTLYPWKMFLRSTSDNIVPLLANNGGDAISFSATIVCTGTTAIALSLYNISGGETGNWIEVDEIIVEKL